MIFAIPLMFVASMVAPVKHGRTYPLIGQTRSEVLAGMGAPLLIYAPRIHDFFAYSPHKRLEVMADAGDVADVYHVQLSGVEFEVQVFYALDSSTSRLSPTERVSNVDFKPDKVWEPEKMVLVTPETRQICASGCREMTWLDDRTLHMYIYKAKPSDQDSRLAAIAAGSDELSTNKWVPCIQVYFRDIKTGEPPVVDFIRVGVVDPAFEKAMQAGLAGSRVTDVEWSPPPQ